MLPIVIKVNKISKIYKLYDSPADRLKETFSFFSRKKRNRDFYAVKKISFEIEKGNSIGFIGENGAGKSTLLKILTGVLTPTSGEFKVCGKVSSLLELGAGFNPDLTGLENVYFYGAVLGFTKNKMDEKIDSILEFADIGKFIHQKVRCYSSGMFVRLAFSVAVQVNPDILIIDEALSVGDIRFQQKCYRRMREFKESGKTILFVTHDLGAVTTFCDYVHWIKDGRIFQHGPPQDVVKKYISYMTYGFDSRKEDEHINTVQKQMDLPEETIKNRTEHIKWEDVSQLASFGEGGVQILNTAMYHKKKNEKIDILKGGEPVVFYLRLKVNEHLENPGFGINTADQLGNIVFSITSFVYDYKIPPFEKGEELICKLEFKFPEIKNGKYSISAAVGDGTLLNHSLHHWIHDVCLVELSNADLKYNMGSVVVKESIFDVGFLNSSQTSVAAGK